MAELRVVSMPMLDTGIGREAGHVNDVALIEAARKERVELEAMLTPEAIARIDAAEAEIDRRFLFGA